MRRKYADDRLKFYIGDIRDYDSIMNAINGVDYIFHSVALKQVPSCEFHPIETGKNRKS
jgi:UDP-N-acetylglucosamine 4,6-dehydratase/5-epimerase